MKPHELDLRLSPHFTLREALKSQTASRFNIDNTPPLVLIPAMMRVCDHILEPIRAHFGIPYSPGSFYRSPALNKAVGSTNPESQHTKGEAVDTELPGIANYDLAKWVSENLDFDQLILECYTPGDPSSGWVHISYVGPAQNRGEILHWDGRVMRRGLA